MSGRDWPLWEVFVRGKGGSRPGQAALGLGLALVQKIIVTHNGRVSAANAEGGGACLTVTLPLRTA